MEARLGAIQQDNSKKLDEMRAVVDEKLSETLQQRFSESFTLISERLESVQKGLGEMQVLAGNVTDLKNILANVKTRGNFGEYQLQTLLEDFLAPDQYEQNFAPKPRSQQRVEFAVRLPMEGEPVYMPIDSKFPIEDYQRLLDAYDQADSALIDSTYRDLVSKALRFARDIRDKYLNPPRTTDYAIMFVPTEGLYAELVRKPGLLDELRKLRVMLAGPNNLQAMLVNFQIGFSSIAISQRAGEIEKLLSAVKTEFGSFQSILEKVDQRLAQARTEIEKATKKTSKIQSRLRGVTELPASESALLLESAEASENDAEIIEVEDIEVEE
jgi:DNA recombination protein RmuC